MIPRFSTCLLIALAAVSVLGNAATYADTLPKNEENEPQRHALLIGLNYSWTLHPRIAYVHHSTHTLGKELQCYGYESPCLLLGRDASREASLPSSRHGLSYP